MQNRQARIMIPTETQKVYVRYRNQYLNQNNNATFRKPQCSDQLNKNVQIYNPKPEVRAQLQTIGYNLFETKKYPIAVVLLLGGYGGRSQLSGCKQFERIYQSLGTFTNLFNIAIKSIFEAFNKNWNITVYLVCSRKNSKHILEEIEKIKIKYPNSTVYICYQAQESVLSSMGQSIIYKDEKNNLTYPCGMGAFLKSKIYYSTTEQQFQHFSLRQHLLQIIKPKYVICFGASNLNQKGIDFQMLGFIEKQKLSCVVKCTQKTHLNTNQLSKVCIRQTNGNPPAWVIMQNQNLQKFVHDEQLLKNLPIWLQSFIFNPEILHKKYPKNDSQLMFQFNQRELTDGNKKLVCLIAEYLVSYQVMRDKQKCMGYMQKQQTSDNFFIKCASDFKTNESYVKSSQPSKIIKNKNK